MSIDNKKSNCGCSCGGSCQAASNNEENARIKILGSGCSNCKKLEENTLEALKEMNIDLIVGHVQDMAKIVSYGVMSTPAIVLDEKVLSYGKVLNKNEIIELLKGKL